MSRLRLLALCLCVWVALDVAARALWAGGGEVVTILTSDGVKLDGRTFGTGETGVVLAPMIDQQIWWVFAERLAEEGFRALTFDLRGVRLSKGQIDLDKIDIDLQAAYDYLHPTVERVVLVGSKQAGAALVKLAARREAAGIVVLSPYLTYNNKDIRAELSALRVPKLFISDGSTDDLRVLMRLAADPKRERRFPAVDRGTNLLESDYGAAVAQEILDFIKHLGAGTD